MERTQLFDLMGELKLYGMKAAFDEIMATAVKRQVKRVVHIVFDNVHLRRDNPDVPSDLEQMPNLLSFIQKNGTISGNHRTPLISYTATDISPHRPAFIATA